MKYLSKFDQLNENVAQSKALLKKLNIEEVDGDYLKIREMIKGNEGYAFWFTKLRFQDDISMDELKNVWDIIKDKNGLIRYFSKPVVKLETLEDFLDEAEKAKIKRSVKRVINQFPSSQKKFFDLKNQNDIDLLKELSKNKSLPALIKKISSFKDKPSFIKAANRLLTTDLDNSFHKLLSHVEKTGASVKVEDEENNIIICEVDYPQLKNLGGDTSCLQFCN